MKFWPLALLLVAPSVFAAVAPDSTAGKVYREILIRVVGPSLRPFGLTNPWVDPRFTLYREGVPAVLIATPRLIVPPDASAMICQIPPLRNRQY